MSIRPRPAQQLALRAPFRRPTKRLSVDLMAELVRRQIEVDRLRDANVKLPQINESLAIDNTRLKDRVREAEAKLSELRAR